MPRWTEGGRTLSRAASLFIHEHHRCRRALIFFKLYWKFLFLMIWPLVSLSVFATGTDVKIRCFYVELVVYGYWVSDAMPEAITGMIPVFALPMLQIQNSFTTCTLYFQYGIFVVSALFMAVVVEHSRLHERLILFFIVKFGATPRVVHFVIATFAWIFSIRIANAYVVQMMLPVIMRILSEIDIAPIERSLLKLRLSTVNFRRAGDRRRPVNLSMAFFCNVIYCSAYGGINFVTGTGTNLTFKAVYQIRFPNCGIEQTAWYCYSIVISFASYVVSVLWLQIIYLGLCHPHDRIKTEYDVLHDAFKQQQIIERLYSKLGRISWHEICVGVAFLIYLSLWYADEVLYFRNMKTIFVVIFISDSTPFLFITFLLILLPAYNTFFYAFSTNPSRRPTMSSPGLMSWEVLQNKVPWGRVIAIGAGISMANAQFTSGLAKEAAETLIFMKDYHYVLNLFLVTLITVILTEFCSNLITCGVFAPVVLELSVLTEVHPLLLGLPFALSCSVGFLSSMASPNVKKITDVVDLPLKDLFIGGIIPKLVCWILIFSTFNYYGKLFFKDSTMSPTNFTDRNVTCYCQPCYFNATFRQYEW